MKFDYWNNYMELLNIIEAQTDLVCYLEKQQRQLERQTRNEKAGSSVLSDMPKSRWVNPVLENVLIRLIDINEKLDIEKQILDEFKRCKDKIETYMASFDGIEHKVLYLRIVVGKDPAFIADSLGFSQGYINNVFSKATKGSDIFKGYLDKAL